MFTDRYTDMHIELWIINRMTWEFVSKRYAITLSQQFNRLSSDPIGGIMAELSKKQKNLGYCSKEHMIDKIVY